MVPWNVPETAVCMAVLESNALLNSFIFIKSFFKAISAAVPGKNIEILTLLRERLMCQDYAYRCPLTMNAEHFVLQIEMRHDEYSL